MFYIIREAGLTPALLEKSDFKRSGDQHVTNALITLHWSCFGIYKICGVERKGWNWCVHEKGMKVLAKGDDLEANPTHTEVSFPLLRVLGYFISPAP